MKPLFRRISLSLLSGLLAGLSTSLFLLSLNWVTSTRNEFPILVWFLPLAGFFIGWLYHRWGQDVANGPSLILDEIHDPKKTVPLRMAPLVLFGTLLTHLFGGSAGREGTAIQMGSSLTDQINHFFKINSNQRKFLLMAGAGAGFGAAIGTPWAGAVFGMEFIRIGKWKATAWMECLIASFVGYYTVVLLKIPHSQFPRFEIESFSFRALFWIAMAGLVFGLSARLFSEVTHFVEKINQKYINYPPLRPFIAGIVLVTLYYLEGTYRYVGLGIPVINESFTAATSILDPLLKMVFTSITVGSGFKGGEFVPLVFVGATLGSALSVLVPVSFTLLSAVGFAAVFAGASNTPIACTIMAIELFGLSIAPYALAACFASYVVSGRKSIYKSQR